MIGYDPDSSAGKLPACVELNPPPVATLPAGQLTDAEPYGPGLLTVIVTVEPVTTAYPLTPAGPVAPAAPAGPWVPVAPVAPWAPVAPVAPVGPCSEPGWATQVPITLIDRTPVVVLTYRSPSAEPRTVPGAVMPAKMCDPAAPVA